MYNIKSILILLFTACIITFSQNDFKDYKPPKLSEGSELSIGINSEFNNASDLRSSLLFRATLNPKLTKWRYSEKLNYFGSFEITANDYYTRYDNPTIMEDKNNSTLQDFGSESYSSSRSSISFRLNLASNYYVNNSKFYAGVNTYIYNGYGNHSRPVLIMYAGPLAGFGKIVDAANLQKTLVFEKILKELGILDGRLTKNLKTKLTELFDRRNNREFTYKFKEDSDIRFFAEVEKLLVDGNVIPNTLNSNTVLMLYRALVNPKFLYYPKLKGYQFQAMFYYPVSITGGEFLYPRTQLMLSAAYGLPINYKTQVFVYAYFNKLIKKYPGTDHNYPYIPASDMFPLAILSVKENRDLIKAFNERFYPGEYESDDFYFGGTVYGFHNISEIIGVRGALTVQSVKYLGGQDYLTDIIESVTLDYNILSRMILSAGLQARQRPTSGEPLHYYFNGILNASYIIF